MGRGKGEKLTEKKLRIICEAHKSNSIDWDKIYANWLLWQLPLNIFEEASEEVILIIYSEIVHQKQVEINLLSSSTARLASMISGITGGIPTPLKDFLPFDLEDNYPELSQKTCIMILKANKLHYIPPNVMANICTIPNLYETICNRAEEDG